MHIMNIPPEIARIEAEAEQYGISLGDICQSAGVHRSTWQRWKSGRVGPTWRKLEAVKAALAEARKGRAA